MIRVARQTSGDPVCCGRCSQTAEAVIGPYGFCIERTGERLCLACAERLQPALVRSVRRVAALHCTPSIYSIYGTASRPPPGYCDINALRRTRHP